MSSSGTRPVLNIDLSSNLLQAAASTCRSAQWIAGLYCVQDLQRIGCTRTTGLRATANMDCNDDSHLALLQNNIIWVTTKADAKDLV